jgi:hypothetical protein
MKKIQIAFLCFFFVAVCSNGQEVILEPDYISVPQKTTHEISFTRDGQTVYFTQTVDNQWSKSQLGFSIYLSDGRWSQPLKVEFVDSLSIRKRRSLVLG